MPSNAAETSTDAADESSGGRGTTPAPRPLGAIPGGKGRSLSELETNGPLGASN
ncbi:hypothetical protein GCM10011490_06740 [Pseudoclavibacter endophyticus]|nr:hypothetical protein GCM10011490_06740 [Pseudoclavibacter endophyticus]